MSKKIPSEQLTPKQRETLLKLGESGMQAEMAKIGLASPKVMIDDPGQPPPGGCYCTEDAGKSWYCCKLKVLEG